jgi:hypothetical protein
MRSGKEDLMGDVESVEAAAAEYAACLDREHECQDEMDRASADARAAESRFVEARSKLVQARSRLLAAAEGKTVDEVEKRNLDSWQRGGLVAFRQ